jgi:hypothetical protein
MAIGFPQMKPDIDARAGQLVLTCRNNLRDIVQFKAWLDLSVNTDLALIALGYTQSEVTLLRASFTDLSKLSGIANATQVQAATSDFFFNAKSLVGLL